MRPGVSSREEPTPCCRLPGQHGTIHTPQARSFTNRKRRKSSRPIYDAVSSLEDHEHADMFLEELEARGVITRMLLGRIFRGHTCGGPPYLDMRAPEWHSCENLAGYRQFFRGHRNSRREYSGLASLTLRRFSLSSC